MLLTRSYHSADCDFNRSLTCCKIKPPPEKLHCFKHLGKPRTDKNIIQHLEKLEDSQSLLKMICLQATNATPLLGHGTTCMRQFRNQLLLPLGGGPQRTATGLKPSLRSWFLLLLQSVLPLLKTSAHQLRRPSKQSDQPGAKYSREQEDGATSTGGSSVTTSRLQQQQASLGAYMRASRKSWTNLEQNSTPENQQRRSDQRQSLADVEMGGALLRAVLQREGCCHLSNGRLCQSWRS